MVDTETLVWVIGGMSVVIGGAGAWGWTYTQNKIDSKVDKAVCGMQHDHEERLHGMLEDEAKNMREELRGKASKEDVDRHGREIAELFRGYDQIRNDIRRDLGNIVNKMNENHVDIIEKIAEISAEIHRGQAGP